MSSCAYSLVASGSIPVQSYQGTMASQSSYGSYLSQVSSSADLSSTPRDVAHVDMLSNNLSTAAYSQSSKFGKYSMRTADGKILLVTPWFPHGVLKTDVTLRDEIEAFASMLQLTPEENSRRHLIRSTVQDSLKSVWPAATVKVYGSFAYGVSLPGSNVDLLVEGLGAGLDDMKAALDRLRESGLVIESSMQNEEAGYAKLNFTAVGITANVSFVRGSSTARKSVSQMRTLLEKFPQARTVFAVARLSLQQARCGDATAGGLSSYALLVMILTACYTCPTPDDSTVLLMDFFRFYGEATSALYVEDPLDPSNNLAEGCVRWPQIRSIFKNSSMSLAKWTGSKVKSGYRGRSPLSSILAYDGLWATGRPGQVQFFSGPSSSPNPAC